MSASAGLQVAVALESPQPEDLRGLSDAGVSELVLVESPPETPDEVHDWADALAHRWRPAMSDSPGH